MISSVLTIVHSNRRSLSEAWQAIGQAIVVVVSVVSICVLGSAFMWLCVMCVFAPHKFLFVAFEVFAVSSFVIWVLIYLLLMAAFHFGYALLDRWVIWTGDLSADADKLNAMISVREAPGHAGARS